MKQRSVAYKELRVASLVYLGKILVGRDRQSHHSNFSGAILTPIVAVNKSKMA
jgi:hypothetical protein